MTMQENEEKKKRVRRRNGHLILKEKQEIIIIAINIINTHKFQIKNTTKLKKALGVRPSKEVSRFLGLSWQKP